MATENKIPKLDRFALDARKWRTDNGLTTPEWEQYTQWDQVRKIAALTVGYLAGFAFGVYATALLIII